MELFENKIENLNKIIDSELSELIKSFKNLITDHKVYYDQLVENYTLISNHLKKNHSILENNFENHDLLKFQIRSEFLKFGSGQSSKNFFTITSKDDFSNLPTGDQNTDWGSALLYTPLNDHSRQYMKKGDVVFCYRQGQFADLSAALDIRGIYGIGFVASDPVELFLDLTGHSRWAVEVVFPLQLKEHLKLRNIQLHPTTINLTPYNGNRNDALQHIAKKEHYETLLNLLYSGNIELKDYFETFFKEYSLQEILLPEYALSNFYDSHKNISEEHISENLIKYEPRNLIVYGAPGTGKSYKLKKLAEELFPHENLRTRITFHPNYSYRNFVGSYKPMPLYKESDKVIYGSDTITKNAKHQKEPFVEYQFEPGPFLDILVRAIQNPTYNFVIIIEEINRANTAGVFGDVFQLLDRNENGESEYSITLEPSAHDYLRTNGINTSSITIPGNLYLWATMNSADQGVMPLDSAFKRRWSFEHIGLNENMNSVDHIYIEIPFLKKENKKLKWNNFRQTINEKLLSEGIHEDKLIGPFFLNKFEISDIKAVKNKLLLYLKEDVLRYKSCLFHGDLKSFSEISERFTNGDNIFSDDIIFTTETLENTNGNIEQSLEQMNSEEIEIQKIEAQDIDAK